MKTVFCKIFEVVFEHRFCDSHKVACIACEPTPACSAILTSRGLIFRAKKNGFSVFTRIKPESDPPQPLIPLAGAFRLSFVAEFIEKTWSRITEFSGEGIFRFDNCESHSAGGVLLLSAKSDGADYATDNDLMTLKPPVFEPAMGYDSGSQPVLFDEYGEEVRAPALIIDRERQAYRIDLSSSPGGVYELRRDSDARQWYVDAFAVRRMPLAMVDIYSGTSMVPGNYRFIMADGSLAEKKYCVRFNALAAKWQYVVVPRYRTDLQESTLSVSDVSGYEFNESAERELPEGRVFVIESAAPISLRQSPVKRLALIKKNNGNATETIVADLPNPDAGSITSVCDAAGKVSPIARMRVYV